MSLSKARSETGTAGSMEMEVAQLRAQLRALADLLIECGLVDESMLEGRLRGAASRAIAQRTEPRSRAPEKPGFWARLFRRRPAQPSARPRPAPRARKQADQTIPVVELPFDPSVLYGEPDLATTDRRRNLTPTEMGKCERCWRMRPLSSARLCARCTR